MAERRAPVARTLRPSMAAWFGRETPRCRDVSARHTVFTFSFGDVKTTARDRAREIAAKRLKFGEAE